jgi:hypothetical protein
MTPERAMSDRIVKIPEGMAVVAEFVILLPCHCGAAEPVWDDTDQRFRCACGLTAASSHRRLDAAASWNRSVEKAHGIRQSRKVVRATKKQAPPGVI